MNMILTSECEKCDYGIIDDSNKARIKVKCVQKDKEYYYGQYIPCDNKRKRSNIMNKIAQFKKVSFEQFLKDYNETFTYEQSVEEIKHIWENIKLPFRATRGSAGYDFFSPFNFHLYPGDTIKIPTGISVQINEGWVLKLYPRSGLGFKYRLQLNNTVGIIDEDYFYSDNEGHIFAKITNDSNENKCVSLKSGDGFIQGIFIPYGITIHDNADGIRNGGFGSTNKRQ